MLRDHKLGAGWDNATRACVCQGYIYVEADKEAHVKEAVSGLRDVFQSKTAKLVPLKEMVDAVSTSQKADPLIGTLPPDCTTAVRLQHEPASGKSLGSTVRVRVHVRAVFQCWAALCESESVETSGCMHACGHHALLCTCQP